MREIKFRGKKKNGTWLFGNLVQRPPIALVFPLDAPDSQDNYIVDLKTVGQFTGLTDKNGKRIFEGDILDFGVLTKRTTVVTFEKGCFMHSTNVLYIGCDAMEVVGNIHDNPELLQ